MRRGRADFHRSRSSVCSFLLPSINLTCTASHCTSSNSCSQSSPARPGTFSPLALPSVSLIPRLGARLLPSSDPRRKRPPVASYRRNSYLARVLRRSVPLPTDTSTTGRPLFLLRPPPTTPSPSLYKQRLQSSALYLNTKLPGTSTPPPVLAVLPKTPPPLNSSISRSRTATPSLAAPPTSGQLHLPYSGPRSAPVPYSRESLGPFSSKMTVY